MPKRKRGDGPSFPSADGAAAAPAPAPAVAAAVPGSPVGRRMIPEVPPTPRGPRRGRSADSPVLPLAVPVLALSPPPPPQSAEQITPAGRDRRSRLCNKRAILRQERFNDDLNRITEGREPKRSRLSLFRPLQRSCKSDLLKRNSPGPDNDGASRGGDFALTA